MPYFTRFNDPEQVDFGAYGVEEDGPVPSPVGNEGVVVMPPRIDISEQQLRILEAQVQPREDDDSFVISLYLETRAVVSHFV